MAKKQNEKKEVPTVYVLEFGYVGEFLSRDYFMSLESAKEAVGRAYATWRKEPTTTSIRLDEQNQGYPKLCTLKVTSKDRNDFRMMVRQIHFEDA